MINLYLLQYIIEATRDPLEIICLQRLCNGKCARTLLNNLEGNRPHQSMFEQEGCIQPQLLDRYLRLN